MAMKPKITRAYFAFQDSQFQRNFLLLGAVIVMGLGSGRVFAAEDWVRLDFRNRIPGVLDAKVYDFDGRPLEGPQPQTTAGAMLYVSLEGPHGLAPVGGFRAFGTGTSAGYWEPFDPATTGEVTLPGVTVGSEYFFEIRVCELLGGTEPKLLLLGRSPLYRALATNTVMTLAGLESLRLEPEKLHIRRQGNQVVIEWTYGGARTYGLEAADSPFPPPCCPWRTIWSRSTYGEVGEVIQVTESVTDAPQYYRLWRSR